MTAAALRTHDALFRWILKTSSVSLPCRMILNSGYTTLVFLNTKSFFMEGLVPVSTFSTSGLDPTRDVSVFTDRDAC